MEKICPPLPTARRKLKKLRARETTAQIIYYSIVSREFARIASAGRDAGGAGLPVVIFHGAVDDNAIRGSARRCRRNFSFVRKFHRAARASVRNSAIIRGATAKFKASPRRRLRRRLRRRRRRRRCRCPSNVINIERYPDALLLRKRSTSNFPGKMR